MMKLTYNETGMALKEMIVDICKYKSPEITVDYITEVTNLKKDIGFDSLDLVDLIFRIEETFDLSIPDDEFDDLFISVGHMAQYIQINQE